MRKKLFIVVVCLVLLAFFNLPYAVAEDEVPHIGCDYGDFVPYGEKKHAGIDYDIPIGTPVIACSDGVVSWIGSNVYKGTPYGDEGFVVMICHNPSFYSTYVHLSEVFVSQGKRVKRGQLIALSGASDNGYQHLHFGVTNLSDGCRGLYSRSLNPHKYWLDGKQQCYDPKQKYSWRHSHKITVPVACGEYREFLKNELKK